MTKLHADPEWQARMIESGKAAMASQEARMGASERMLARHASEDENERNKLPKRYRSKVTDNELRDLFDHIND